VVRRGFNSGDILSFVGASSRRDCLWAC